MPARPVTYDHLKSRKKPTMRFVDISLDDDAQAAYEDDQSNLEDAKFALQNSPDDADAKAKVLAAEEAVKASAKAAKDASQRFKFRSIGRKKYDDLVGLHPPTDAQRKEIEKEGGDPDNLSWNPDTFPKALVAASITEPLLTPEQVDEMWASDDWSESETAALSVTALEANNSRRIVSLGKD